MDIVVSLTNKTTIGIFWNFSQQLATKGVSVLVTLVLASLLVPKDFGLVAMMAVFLAIGSSLMESGFREALIRFKNITQEDFVTAFYANIFLGLISYVVLYIVAPTISAFYNEIELTYLIRIASITVIIQSFQSVQLAKLTRNLDFKLQLKASLPANIISGFLAIYLAYIGWGVWALISQTIISAFIHTLLLWIVVGWRPTLGFSITSFKEMYNFGYKLFFSGILNTVFQNSYIVIIAKLYSAPVAGLYFFSEKINSLLVQQLVFSIQAATYPALAKIQDEDQRLRSAYKSLIVVMTMILFPIFLLIAVVAEPLFQLIFDEKWWPAISYFQLLCIASLITPLHVVNLNILNVKGRSDLFLFVEIIKKILICIMLAITYKYGVLVILYGQIALSVISYFINGYFSYKILRYSLLNQIKDFSTALIISFLSFIVSLYAINYLNIPPFYKLVVISLLFSMVYIVGSIVFNNKKCKVLIDIFSSFLKNKTI